MADLASDLPQLSRPEVEEARRRIPTADAVKSGQRNRPTKVTLIREKAQANRAQDLGSALNDLLNGRLTPPEPPPLPPEPTVRPSP